LDVYDLDTTLDSIRVFECRSSQQGTVFSLIVQRQKVPRKPDN
jgi:hypothetical protein